MPDEALAGSAHLIPDPVDVRRNQCVVALAPRAADHDCFDIACVFAFFDTLQHFGLFDRADLYRQTATLAVPTMLMWGTADRVTPISGLDEVRGLLAPEQCHVVDDCGQMIPFERPALVAEKLAEFAAPHTDW